MNHKKTIRQDVESILRDFPNTRDSDKALTLKYWETVEEMPTDSMESFKNWFVKSGTSLESITRARRLIQEEGKYLPIKQDVISRRRKRELAMKQSIIKNREVI